MRNQRLLSSRENHVLADLAVRHRHGLGRERTLAHIDDPQLAFAEGGDVSLGHIAVVEDVMGDEIRRQRYSLDNLFEVGRRGIDVNDGDPFLSGLARDR